MRTEIYCRRHWKEKL